MVNEILQNGRSDIDIVQEELYKNDPTDIELRDFSRFNKEEFNGITGSFVTSQVNVIQKEVINLLI